MGEALNRMKRLAVQPCCASTFTKRNPTRCPQGRRQRRRNPMPEGNQYEHIAVSGSGRQHFGDSYYTANTTNNYYPLRQWRSDETIRYHRRGGRLLEAAKDGQRLRLQYLLQELGVSVDHEDEHGLTALHYAAWSGFVDCAECLIRKGAYVNAHSDKYGTPLCLAVVMSRLDVVKLLLKGHRANVNADGGLLGSALHASCHRTIGTVLWPVRTRTAELLRSFGAQVMSRKKVSIEFFYALQKRLPVPDPPGGFSLSEMLCEPIHIAADTSYLHGLNVLMDDGADVNWKAQWITADKKYPETPLELSCSRDSAPLVLPLLDRGASHQPRGLNSAIHIAAQKVREVPPGSLRERMFIKYHTQCWRHPIDGGSVLWQRRERETAASLWRRCVHAESKRIYCSQHSSQLQGTRRPRMRCSYRGNIRQPPLYRPHHHDRPKTHRTMGDRPLLGNLLLHG